jgi:hypothetical protein
MYRISAPFRVSIEETNRIGGRSTNGTFVLRGDFLLE